MSNAKGMPKMNRKAPVILRPAVVLIVNSKTSLLLY